MAIDASHLCLECGLCCDGTLFEVVKLQATDSVERLEKAGIPVFRKKKEPYFKQPCSCLLGKTCQAYAERPVRCHHFECQPLKGLQQGESTLQEALQTIHTAQERIHTFKATFGFPAAGAESLPTEPIPALRQWVREKLAQLPDKKLSDASDELFDWLEKTLMK